MQYTLYDYNSSNILSKYLCYSNHFLLVVCCSPTCILCYYNRSGISIYDTYINNAIFLVIKYLTILARSNCCVCVTCDTTEFDGTVVYIITMFVNTTSIEAYRSRAQKAYAMNAVFIIDCVRHSTSAHSSECWCNNRAPATKRPLRESDQIFGRGAIQ